MSDDEQTDENNEDSGEEKQRVGCIASLIPVTTPGCSALLTFVFLVFTVAAVWLYFWLDPNNVPWRHSYSWLRIAAIVAAVFILPWLVYKTVALWIEGTPASYPEVDAAWKAGLHALESNELSIHSVPIFMIVGASSEAQEKALMNATGHRFSVEGVPQGPAPIHWYANSEAIYIFCSDTSWASALASLREEMAADAKAEGINFEAPSSSYIDIDVDAIRRSEFAANPAPSYAPPAQSTGYSAPSSFGGPPSYNAPSGYSAPSSPTPPAEPASPTRLRGTLELNDFIDSSSSRSAKPIEPTPIPPTNYRGTLMLGDMSAPATSQPVPTQRTMTPRVVEPAPSSYPQAASNYPEPSPSSFPPASAPATNYAASTSLPAVTFRNEPNALQRNQKQVLVSHQYSSACLQELSYLCQLIRKQRQPLCGINGILSLIQFESIHSSLAETEELKKALRSDVATIQSSLALRSPVTSLIVGLEKERGFQELVRRVGRDRALTQRFGRRFDVQAIPRKEELVAFATLACGTFEDWAYTLFREPEALSKPGNTRLYELLSKVRCAWKGKLADLISGGFGTESVAQAKMPFYSGCYFAATGETPDRQAFVRGVIEKLIEEQEMVEWTEEKLSSYRLHQRLATTGMVLTLILVILLVAQFLYFNLFGQ